MPRNCTNCTLNCEKITKIANKNFAKSIVFYYLLHKFALFIFICLGFWGWLLAAPLTFKFTVYTL